MSTGPGKATSVRVVFVVSRRIALVAALLTGLGIGVGACGGGVSDEARQTAAAAHSSATVATQAVTTGAAPAPSEISPQTIVAHVAGKPIQFATVKHLMALASAPKSPPDPPGYSACIARTRAEEAPQVLEGAAEQTEARLKQDCQKRYETLLSDSVSKAIHIRWLIGEAAEDGLPDSPTEIQREFNEGKKYFKTNAEFEAYRKSTGQSIADMKSQLQLNKLGDEIFKLIKSKQHPPTSADIAAYYDSHRQKFAVPEGRDVFIFRTTTKVSALRAKSEIQAGKSFAHVAKHLSQIGQPISAEQGEVKDLLPGVYEEKILNDAIFNAKPNRLYGPIELVAEHKTIAPETNTGFFVFEVRKMVPGRQTPFGEVRNSIAEELTEADKNKTLSGFVAAFRSKWTARTACAPRYVVRNCKQYKNAKAEEARDPYTL